MAKGTYRLLVDWGRDNGLHIGDFEAELHGWEPEGAILPTAALSSVRSKQGENSMLISWAQTYAPFTFGVSQFGVGTWGVEGVSDPGAYDQSVFRVVDGLTVGRVYHVEAWVYVPAGSPAVTLSVDGAGSDTSASTDVWVLLEVEFTGSATSHTLRVLPASDPNAGDQVWVDAALLFAEGSDLTDRWLGARGDTTVRYGREAERATSAFATGESAFLVDNRTRDYSPENALSPLFGQLGPGRSVLMRGLFDGHLYNLFSGFLDDYDVMPYINDRAVSFTALDAIVRLRDVDLSTELHFGVRSGDAINLILDEVEWPQDQRDIDPGVSHFRWWWEEGTDALEALHKVVDSEGPPATLFMDPYGKIVFRDRHHRYLRDASQTVQATLRDSGIEPNFSQPMDYRLGWKDIANTIDLSVDVRRGHYTTETVWKQGEDQERELVQVQPGETVTMTALSSDPFIGAVIPVEGTDFELVQGAVTVSLSRRTGQSVDIRLFNPSGTLTEVLGLSLRATPVQVSSSLKVSAKDVASIDEFGPKKFDLNPVWAGVHDALAIAQIIVGTRAGIVPTVSLTVNHGRDERLEQQLSRDLSDRIQIVEAETTINDPYYIDRIEHSIRDAGHVITTEFSCERVVSQPDNVFRFDVEGSGFDDGVFGIMGVDEPDTMFRFDVEGQGFDDGLFAH